MRFATDLGTLLTATAAALFVGCSAAGTSPPTSSAVLPSGGQQFSSAAPKAKNPVAFISDWDNDVVDIINSEGSVTTLHVYGPEGLAVDASHKLYVVEGGGSNVLIYSPPYNGSPKVLTNAGVQPVGVAVDRYGNVAVTSLGSTSVGPGAIVFYAKGHTSPTNTITANAQFAGDYYCAFDASGNLYVDSKNGSGPFEAGEVVGGITGNAVTPLTTGNLVQYPGGMQVTRNGQIAILDQANGSGTPTIYTYNPPSAGSFGSPVKTTQLEGSNDSVAFAFQGRHERFVLTADTFFTSERTHGVQPNHEDQIGQTQLFDYPGGGSAMSSVRLAYNATIVGVAVNPSQSP